MSNIPKSEKIINKVKKYLKYNDIDKVIDIKNIESNEDFWSIYYEHDMRTQLMINKLIYSYDSLSLEAKNLIDKCNVFNTKEVDDWIKFKNWEKLNPFNLIRKCKKNQMRVGIGYCIDKCPIGYEWNKKFSCIKQKSYNSKFFTEYQENTISFREKLHIEKCYHSFKNIELNFCIQECPTGLMDYNSFCQLNEILPNRIENIISFNSSIIV